MVRVKARSRARLRSGIAPARSCPDRRKTCVPVSFIGMRSPRPAIAAVISARNTPDLVLRSKNAGLYILCYSGFASGEWKVIARNGAERANEASLQIPGALAN